jgi:hypothetical protein
MAIVPIVSADDRLDQTGNHFSIVGLTTMKIYNVHDKNELTTSSILSPQDLTIPGPVKKFDLVTFDIPSINENIKKNQNLDVLIGNTEYSMKLTRSNFENIDDGIDSYYGTLNEIKDSEVLLTISENIITGSVRLNNDTYYIKPVEPRIRISMDRPVLHIIYSSADVVQDKPMKIDDGTLKISGIKELAQSSLSSDSNDAKSVNSVAQ